MIEKPYRVMEISPVSDGGLGKQLNPTRASARAAQLKNPKR